VNHLALKSACSNSRASTLAAAALKLVLCLFLCTEISELCISPRHSSRERTDHVNDERLFNVTQVSHIPWKDSVGTFIFLNCRCSELAYFSMDFEHVL